MIKDRVRTNTYRNAIFANAEDFKDKIVIDVGAGTCILSFFCIQAGAAKVYAIEASNIADHAREVVKHNKMQDKIIIIKGRVEDVEIEEKADIIISEWMGYCLLYESMLESVIIARDKWLKQEGIMFPAWANIFMCPFTDEQLYIDKIDFWNDIYGIDFSPMIPFAKKCAFEEPLIDLFLPQNELAIPLLIKTICCKTVASEQLKYFASNFKFSAIGSASLQGFVLWFDVLFKGSDPMIPAIRLTTDPESEPTHWRQSMFFIPDPIDIKQDQLIEGSIKVEVNNENKRTLDFEFKLNTTDNLTLKYYMR